MDETGSSLSLLRSSTNDETENTNNNNYIKHRREERRKGRGNVGGGARGSRSTKATAATQKATPAHDTTGTATASAAARSSTTPQPSNIEDDFAAKYSTENWNQQHPSSTETLVPSNHPSDHHAQSDLVGIQLDPSQFHQPWATSRSKIQRVQRKPVVVGVGREQQQQQQQQRQQQPINFEQQQQKEQDVKYSAPSLVEVHHQHQQLQAASNSSVILSSRQQQQQQRIIRSQQQQQHTRSHSQPHFSSYNYSIPTSSSQPPQLPPLSASLSPISPFFGCSHLHDNNTNNSSHHYSHTSSPPSPSPALPPRVPPPDDILVSPVSPGPDISSNNNNHYFDDLTPPSSRRRRTWDTQFGSSVLDDPEFELSLRVASPTVVSTQQRPPVPQVAVTNAVAHDAAQLSIDDRSDDWFAFTAPSAIFEESHATMAAVTASEWSQPYHHHQQQQQQPVTGSSAAASSSFTPLPLIRHTSNGFDLLREKGLINEDGSDSAPSPIEKDTPTIPSFPPQFSSQQSSLAARQSSPHNSMQPAMMQQMQQQQQQQQQPFQQQQIHMQGFNPNPQLPPQPNGFNRQPDPMQMQPQAQSQYSAMGRGASPGQQFGPGQGMNGVGQPFIAPPVGRQWEIQESRLAQPLNPTNRNRSNNSPPQPERTAYDKETEDEGGAPPVQQPMPPVQSRQRNGSNPSMPPSAASKYPGLFPDQSYDNHMGRQPGQVPMPQHPLLRNNPMAAVPRRQSLDDRAKDNGVHIDQTPVPPEDHNEKGRRGSGSLFSIVHRRTGSGVTESTQGASGQQEKKKTFFPSIPGIIQSQPKNKSNLGMVSTPVYDSSDVASNHSAADTAPVKKKLSELKGMIRGVGNAKEGAKDDQPVRVGPVYDSSIPAIMNEPRNGITHAHFGVMGAQRQMMPQGQQAPFKSQGQPGAFNQQQPRPRSFEPDTPQPQQQPQPQVQQQSPPPQQQPQNPAPQQVGHRMLTGLPPGLGRTGTAGPNGGEAQHPQQAKSEENSKIAGFLGGFFNKQTNKAKEPKPQAGPQAPQDSQRPIQSFPRVGQIPVPLGPHPMLAGQPPFQSGPPGHSPSPSLTQESNQPPPSLETAQAIMMRRPSEITVSSQVGSPPRPGLSQQASQSTLRQRAGSGGSFRSPENSIGDESTGNAPSSRPQTSPRLSQTSTIAAGVPRISPNRKPVGSGSSRINARIASAISPPPVDPSAVMASSRLSDQTSSSRYPSTVQQSPSIEESVSPADNRQPSMPSPAPSPAPSQSNESSSPGMRGEQFPSRFPEPGRPGPGPGQGLGVYQNGLVQPGALGPPKPNGQPNALVLGPNGFRPVGMQNVQPLPPASPATTLDQSKLSKFFGAYDGGKPAEKSQAGKEKSAASKLLGALKRSKDKSDVSTQQSAQIDQPVMKQVQVPRQAMPGQPHAQMKPGAGRGQIAPQQMQAGIGQPSQIPPQAKPGQAAAGRGQPVPMAAGRGQPNHPGPGGMLPPQQPRPPKTTPLRNGNEPTYDQVPIPPGYRAVHGYGPGGMIAFSPYNGFPVQYAPMQPGMQHPGFPMQQWDPRMMPPPQPGMPYGFFPGGVPPQGFPQGFQPQGQPRQQQLPPGALPPHVQAHYNMSQAQAQAQAAQQQQNQAPGQSPPPGQDQAQMPQELAQQQVMQQRMSQEQMAQQQMAQSQAVQAQARSPPPGQDQANAPMTQQQMNQQRLAQEQITQRQMTQQQTAQRMDQNTQVPQIQMQQPDMETGRSSGTQTPVNSDLRQTPTNSLSPPHVRQSSPPIANMMPPQGQINGIPAASAPDRSFSPPQAQHIAMGQHSGPSSSQSSQANSIRQSSSTTQTSAPPSSVLRASVSSEQNAAVPTTVVQGSEIISAPEETAKPLNAARLTSRLSVSHEPLRNRPQSPETQQDRAMTVSPEPPAPRHAPLSSVSEQHMRVNVERANSHVRGESEDIYDATPRLDNSRLQVDEIRETSESVTPEQNHVIPNGVVSAGPPSDNVLPDNMSFLDGPDSSEPDDEEGEATLRNDVQITPPQQTVPMNTEPEEKILVDEPAELAAVNDDDDGLLLMSATSYPGQEWNPYGAGEFGDWE
ncbi:hypothetical protein F5Y16DRAFT_416359 [Xylariaceae sp. FL0255]|nr:hypothetical protein F5Y16DRAFT_416359 [Xylariaceae sp. FL0255]